MVSKRYWVKKQMLPFLYNPWYILPSNSVSWNMGHKLVKQSTPCTESSLFKSDQDINML